MSVENEEKLRLLKDKIHSKGLKYIAFYEPDIENQLTAIAIEPCELSKKMISNLPLMLKSTHGIEVCAPVSKTVEEGSIPSEYTKNNK